MSLGRIYNWAISESNLQLKTQLCRPYTDSARARVSGFCSWGERCRYAHGLEELRGGLGGAGRGTGGEVEAFLRRIRSQEEEKEVGGEDTVVEEVVKLNT